jgi:hypothetical protein
MSWTDCFDYSYVGTYTCSKDSRSLLRKLINVIILENHIYEIVEKYPPKKIQKKNPVSSSKSKTTTTRMSAIVTLCMPLTKC